MYAIRNHFHYSKYEHPNTLCLDALPLRNVNLHYHIFLALRMCYVCAYMTEIYDLSICPDTKICSATRRASFLSFRSVLRADYAFVFTRVDVRTRHYKIYSPSSQCVTAHRTCHSSSQSMTAHRTEIPRCILSPSISTR